MDHLVDRDCVILDGKCDCPRQEGKAFPDCKKYGKKEEPLNHGDNHEEPSRYCRHSRMGK